MFSSTSRPADGTDEAHETPARVDDLVQGCPWLKELYDYFAPARREALERGYTEEEINLAIDEAVTAVRGTR